MLKHFKPNKIDFLTIAALVLLGNLYFYPISWYFQLVLWPFVFYLMAYKFPNVRAKRNSYEIRRKPLDFTQLLIFLGYFYFFCLRPLYRETEPILTVLQTEINNTIWLILIVLFIRHYKLFLRTSVTFNPHYLNFYLNKKIVSAAYWEIEYAIFENTEIKIKLIDKEEFSDYYLEISNEQKHQLQTAFNNFKMNAKTARELTLLEKLQNKKDDGRLTTFFIGISVIVVIWFLSMLF